MVDKTHPKLDERIEPTNWTDGLDMPMSLMDQIPEDPAALADLANRSVVSGKQFTREQATQLCRLAAKFETTQTMGQFPLTGKILISAFYEPSTRTRLSFESVWHRLGGDVISITDPSTTGVAKGESLHDVAEMMSHYGDVVVLRDSNEEAIYEMLDVLRIPIINAGNGTDEHPTQALADIYAIAKWRPEFLMDNPPADKKIRICVIGVPGRITRINGKRLGSQPRDVLDHGRLPDPVVETLKCLVDRVELLEGWMRDQTRTTPVNANTEIPLACNWLRAGEMEEAP